MSLMALGRRDNMDSFVTPRLLNHIFNGSLKEDVSSGVSINSTLLRDVLNDSVVREDDMTNTQRLLGLLMCLLGMPGNVLVIAVYVCKMTTSTRVYMLALAVADLMVCVCGIVFTARKLDSVGYNVFAGVSRVSVTFSVFLLAFVSMERLLAVRRPHTFSLSPRRAKWALLVICVATVVSVAVLEMARVMHYDLLRMVCKLIITITSVVILIVCYTLMAITMLMNTRAARRNVGVTPSPVPGPSTVSTVTSKGTASVGVNSKKINSVSGIKMTKAKEAKNVLLLFTITVVLFACWMPYWLYGAGVYVPSYLKRIYFLNSVVNPFIYSALSRMFRDDVRQFCRQMRSRLTTCLQ